MRPRRHNDFVKKHLFDEPAVRNKAEFVKHKLRQLSYCLLLVNVESPVRNMVFRDRPPEIQSRILEFCSPSDLAVLSRVHTLGRDVAEYALYSRIQYRVRPSDLVMPSRNVECPHELKEDRCLLHTFANNSWKASMVKMLHVELEAELLDENTFHDHRTRIKLIHFILVKLAEALVKMSNLVDLRILHIQMHDMDDLESDVLKGPRRISEVIRGDYFKLHTLYLEDYHYLEVIVADQPHLRLLGIHSHYWNSVVPQINKLHQGLSPGRTTPTVFTLSYGPTVTMFPAFHLPGEALRACREVSTSLTNLHGFFRQDRYRLSVSLLGTSERNISLLSELMEAMAICLQEYCPRGTTRRFNVIVHEESIQMPWRFPEFIKPLALFENVRILNIDYICIDFEKLYQMATDLEFCMLNKLKHTWPNLQEIRFFCRTGMPDVLLMKCESNWKATECFSQLESVGDELETLEGIPMVSDDE